jgi:hypothetical protein
MYSTYGTQKRGQVLRNIDVRLHIEAYYTKPAKIWFVNIFGIFDHISPNICKRIDFACFFNSTPEFVGLCSNTV